MDNTAEQQPLNKFEDSTWAKLDEEIGFKPTEPFSQPAPEDKVQEIIDNGVSEQKAQDNATKEKIDVESTEEPISDTKESEEEKAEASDPGDDQVEADASEDEPKVDYDMEIEVPMPYGMEPKTIGQLKDEVAKMHLTEQKVTERENQLSQDTRLLSDLIDSLGELPPETMANLDQYRHQRLSREGKLLMQAIPEWSDNAIYMEDQKQMLGLASDYGFSETEFRSVADHRLVRLLRDHAKLKSRLNGASKPKPGKKTTQKPQQRQRVSESDRLDNLFKQAAQSKDKGFKQAAIEKLLGK